MSEKHSWSDEFPGSIIVCDAQGMILEMNARAIDSYADDGGAALIGTDVFACHPEPSRSQLREMMRMQTQNVYTVHKKGRTKLVCQSPWYKDGEFAGFVEIVVELAGAIPHIDRDFPAS